MHHYRQTYGPFSGCSSYQYLSKLLSIRQPEITLRIKDIQSNQETVFFPRSRVREILGKKDAIDDILQCRCPRCKKHLVSTSGDAEEISQSILSRNHPKVLLLAILIYLGYSYLIKFLALQAEIHDSALSIEERLLERDDFPDLMPIGSAAINSAMRRRAEAKLFLDNYRQVRMFFDLPVFNTSERWTQRWDDDYRFPFLDDQKHGEGAFGQVFKFNIHPEYLNDIDANYARKDWWLTKNKVRFSPAYCNIY